MKMNMKRTAYILFLTLILFSGKVAAQCVGDLTANISGGSPLICNNTSPGTFTATGGGESGLYTYLWYKNSIATGITTQTYSPGILSANTTVYCAISSGVCGPVNTATVSIIVAAIPAAPIVGPIVQPTCNVSTGSVALGGLPTDGDWTITSTPSIPTVAGNGPTTTINGLIASTTYTFKVTSYAGCGSPVSGQAVIQAQPSIPNPPLVGIITAPTCSVGTGSVVLNGLPATGTWTLKRYPGSITSTGTGTTATISGLPPNTYNFSVTNAAGCGSTDLSDNVVIPAQPGSPTAPVIGPITQPTCSLGTGSVVLNGLPSAGIWTVTMTPTNRIVTNSGTTTTITAIAPGTYTFTVTAANACISPSSVQAVINAQPLTPSAPVVSNITQPTCAVATGTVVLNSLPATGNWVLTYNPGNVTTTGSGTTWTISNLIPNNYTFTVTNDVLCPSPALTNVIINAQPPSPPSPATLVDCTLGFNHAVITVTSPVGAGYEYSLNGGAYQPAALFSEKANGNYFVAVRNSSGCTTVGSIFPVSCGCTSAPSLVLSAASGNTCGITPVTVSDNTFGDATSVTITEDGAGSVDQSTISISPFAFTYTPAIGDGGKVVNITVTTDNPMGSPCSSATSTYVLTVNAIPSPPSVGPVTSLTCTTTTGSVVLNGLPSVGNWILTRYPDNVITNGTSTSTTITGLAAGTYTFTVASDAGCISVESVQVVINPQPDSPTAPIIGTIVQPTCTISTGSVDLSGLPAGTWTLTRLPVPVTRTGSTSTYTVAGIPSGTYTYTVTNSSGCVSPESVSFDVNPQPPIPATPSIGTITPPSCTSATGSVVLHGLPADGTWTVTRRPVPVTYTGTGTTDTIFAIPPGPYNFTVTNKDGCESVSSSDVVIPARPPIPLPPVVGTITQPTYILASGSVVLSGLPSGSWTLIRLPSGVTTAGSGSTITVSGLAGGKYYFTVRNSVGCVSDSSNAVIISTLGPPKLVITNPPAACAPAKVDLTNPAITEGSTTGLTFTYWTDSATTLEYLTPASATAGKYYILGTTVSGFSSHDSVIVTIEQMPVANGGPDQTLSLKYSTTMAAVIGENESGFWHVGSGTGVIADTTNPLSSVSDLSTGDNIMLWIVSNAACPADTARVKIKVGDLLIPTLITPNGDPYNEYFDIRGLSSLGKSELIIFDRRGAEVFKNSDYDNKWNGVDYNENPLPNDTYFFVLNSSKGRIVKGYIVIRR